MHGSGIVGRDYDNSINPKPDEPEPKRRFRLPYLLSHNIISLNKKCGILVKDT
jgi:hypothetical protein